MIRATVTNLWVLDASRALLLGLLLAADLIASIRRNQPSPRAVVHAA